MAKRIGFLALLCATGLLAVTAYWLLFTTFMGHDDEGYVLISLKNYSAHGGLYAGVYSQYGPFFYFVHDLGHRFLGYDFTNTNGRFITLICWMIAVGACAQLVWRETRDVALTGFTLALTFFHLWLMVGEPIHPGGMIAALVAVGAAAGAELIRRGAISYLAVLAGLLGAALFLTKINVGLFFIAAAGTWSVVQWREPKWAGRGTVAVAVALLALPFGLMHAELAEPWARTYAELSAAASCSMLAASWIARRPAVRGREVGLGALAAFAVLGIVGGSVWLRGTSGQEMLEGILLGPLRHPAVYHYPPFWRPGVEIAAAFSLVLALAVWQFGAGRLAWLLVVLRLGLVAWIALASLEWVAFTSHSSIMSYGVPFAWLFALRLAPGAPEKDIPSVAPWVGLLLVLQFLHAYPVAGSQVAWGTFLALPLMALGMHDTRLFLLAHRRSAVAFGIGVVSATLAVGCGGRLALIGWHRYAQSRPLGLPGAEDVRPPEDLATTLRMLTLNATAQGDLLFSLPGMYSFNGWTGLPTPTLNNTTHWFSLLTARQQGEIAAALERSKRPVVIVHQGLLEFLTDSKFVISSPLHDYLDQHFTRAFTLGKYEFRVRRGRSMAVLSTAEFLQLKTADPHLPAARLELVVALPSGARLARIELATLDDDHRTLSRWDKSSGPLFSTPINLQGTAIGPESPTAWDQPLPSLVRLDLPLPTTGAFDRKTNIFYLRAADGSLLAEARFIE